MSLWRQLIYGFKGLVNRQAHNRDIADEFEQYLEQATRHGWSVESRLRKQSGELEWRPEVWLQ